MRRWPFSWTHRCSNVRSRALLQGLGGHVCVPCIPGINFCTGPIVIFRYFFSVFLWLAALFSVVSRLFLFLAIAPSFSLLLDLKLVENFVSHCGFWKNGSVWLLAYHRFLKKKKFKFQATNTLCIFRTEEVFSLSKSKETKYRPHSVGSKCWTQNQLKSPYSQPNFAPSSINEK